MRPYNNSLQYTVTLTTVLVSIYHQMERTMKTIFNKINQKYFKDMRVHRVLPQWKVNKSRKYLSKLKNPSETSLDKYLNNYLSIHLLHLIFPSLNLNNRFRLISHKSEQTNSNLNLQADLSSSLAYTKSKETQ